MKLMPELICPDCGKRLFHENETTLKVMQTICSKFCIKQEGEPHSYIHRDPAHMEPIDPERANDSTGTPIIKQ